MTLLRSSNDNTLRDPRAEISVPDLAYDTCVAVARVKPNRGLMHRPDIYFQVSGVGMCDAAWMQSQNIKCEIALEPITPGTEADSTGPMWHYLDENFHATAHSLPEFTLRFTVYPNTEAFAGTSADINVIVGVYRANDPNAVKIMKMGVLKVNGTQGVTSIEFNWL